MDTIKKVLDDLGLKYDIEDKNGSIEFWIDTAGQDVYTDVEYDGTPEDFVKKFKEAAESYDVWEEVELYVEMRGKGGVPKSVEVLIDDMREAKKTLLDIAEKLEKALVTREDDTFAFVDVTIYEDALCLLLNGKPNIKDEILNQMQQGDPCMENFGDEIREEAETLVMQGQNLNVEIIMNGFDEASCEDLLSYVEFDEDKIKFDYGESEACSDLKVVAFSVPCKFNVSRYIREATV